MNSQEEMISASDLSRPEQEGQQSSQPSLPAAAAAAADMQTPKSVTLATETQNAAPIISAVKTLVQNDDSNIEQNLKLREQIEAITKEKDTLSLDYKNLQNQLSGQIPSYKEISEKLSSLNTVNQHNKALQAQLDEQKNLSDKFSAQLDVERQNNTILKRTNDEILKEIASQKELIDVYAHRILESLLIPGQKERFFSEINDTEREELGRLRNSAQEERDAVTISAVQIAELIYTVSVFSDKHKLSLDELNIQRRRFDELAQLYDKSKQENENLISRTAQYEKELVNFRLVNSSMKSAIEEGKIRLEQLQDINETLGAEKLILLDEHRSLKEVAEGYMQQFMHATEKLDTSSGDVKLLINELKTLHEKKIRSEEALEEKLNEFNLYKETEKRRVAIVFLLIIAFWVMMFALVRTS